MIPGLINKITGRSKYRKEDNPEPPFKDSKTIEEKIEQIVKEKRDELRHEEMRRARMDYRIDLFFRGYQNLEWDEASWQYNVYDDQPMEFTENRFRRDALILQGSMIRMEPLPIVRPASESFNDMEAAKAGQAVLDICYEHIDNDNVIADKSLYKVLFGNAFKYSDYQMDRRLGTILVPKFRYENVEIPGAAFCECGYSGPLEQPMCPQCGGMMEPFPPMQTEAQVQDGYEEREQGQEFTVVCSPLEVAVRSSVKGGLKNAPYLLWKTREDTDIVQYVYPKLDIKPATRSSYGRSEFDSAIRYQEVLGSLTSPAFGDSRSYATERQYNTVDTVRAWIRPCCYKGDKELTKQAPDGLMAVLIEGEVVEWRAELMDDHWTHEVGIRNPHSFYGDGMMFDAVPMSRLGNKINNLQSQHLEYDTIPLRLYESDMINEEDITNDPSKKWIPVATSPEKDLSKAVRDLVPGHLSMDVQLLKNQVNVAHQDVTGATDPVAGKIAGANTPYSAQVLAVEQGQTRMLGSMKYNAGAVRQDATILLQIAQKNWIDPRHKAEIDENIGRTTWKTFTGADLSQGSWVIKLPTNDFTPKTRADAMAGLEYLKTFGFDPMASPKSRLHLFEITGNPVEGDVPSTQARRAYRVIDKIRTTGQQVIPDPLVDDGTIQAPVIQDFLASQQGEQLQEENPQAWQLIRGYLETVLQMAAMKQMAMAGMGMPPMTSPGGGPPSPPGGPSPAKPSQPPGGQAGQAPGGPKQEMAQSPVPQSQQRQMPALPQGVR